MTKVGTYFALILLLTYFLSSAARHEPTGVRNQKDAHVDDMVEDDDGNCEGLQKEECLLVRRTLVAHVDYIYSQGHHH